MAVNKLLLGDVYPQTVQHWIIRIYKRYKHLKGVRRVWDTPQLFDAEMLWLFESAGWSVRTFVRIFLAVSSRQRQWGSSWLMDELMHRGLEVRQSWHAVGKGSECAVPRRARSGTGGSPKGLGSYSILVQLKINENTQVTPHVQAAFSGLSCSNDIYMSSAFSLGNISRGQVLLLYPDSIYERTFTPSNN